MGDQAQIKQLAMLGIVIVNLCLDPRVGQMVDSDLKPFATAGPLHQVGQIKDAKLLGELVEDPILTGLRRLQDGELDTPKRVANIQEAAGLPASAIYRDRPSYRGLHTVPVEDGAPDAVVIKARGQAVIEDRFVRFHTVHDTLVKVRRANPPDLASEMIL